MGSQMRAYQLFFLQLLLFYSHNSAQLCSHEQSSALLRFKQLFSFMNVSTFHCDLFTKYSYLGPMGYKSAPYCDGRCPSYPKTMSWKEDIDCCLWDGVTCDTATGHVIGLDLSCGWLHGSIPSNSSLFLLSHLQRLNLAFNDFKNSKISSDFSQLPSLTHLNLSNSNFSGSIPSELSQFSKLVSLDLSSYDFVFNDQFDENILRLEISVFKGLVQNLTELTELILDSVDMSTVVPSLLTNLSSSLTSLSLNDCGLQGNFPDSIFRLPKLQILRLRRNFNLTGNFPKANWSSPLKFLDVSDMSMSGKLPNSIGDLMSLGVLNLNNCTLIGKVPASLGNLTELTHLSLYYNNFSGHIPSFLSNLKHLYYLDLSSNNFTRGFPDIFVNLTQLSLLDFSSNHLAGPIPSHISGLRNLVALYLYGNSLNGTIPSWLFSLPFLKILNLNYNELTGQIDEFRSNSLQIIDLSDNRLNGLIPSSIFELVNLTHLELSSNNLSGIFELHMFAKLKNLEFLDLSSNKLSGNVELCLLFAKLQNLGGLDLSHNNLSLSTSCKANSFIPKVYSLRLLACNISEFPEILKSLDQLDELDLSNNEIHGRIPNWMWDVGKDTLSLLNLSHNFLTSIEKLPWKNLRYLDLRSNLLQGPLPIPPTYLGLLLLSNNKLTGEIPHLICNMSTIEILDLSNNSLSGTIPECMGNLSTLHVLDLQKNRFYGTIPRTFAKGNHFRTLNFNGNRLEGSVSQSLVYCTMLEVLDLGNNKIKDTFPYWLGSLPQLRVLVLRSNKFYGSIQSSSKAIFLFPKLTIFDLSSNNFSGSLPARFFENLNAMMNIDDAKRKLQYMGETYYQDSITVTLKGFEIQLVKIITILTTIDFSNNNFGGKIPEVIGKLQALHLLNLSHNSLVGHIPSLLGNLTALESLDLSSNKLVGKIPWELTRLNFLQVLNLSENQLVGPIPRDNHFDTFPNTSYVGNLGLCGFPLSNECWFDETPQTPSTSEDDAESAYKFGWKVVLMGYGCGMVLGLIIGYLVFSTGKPQWLVRIVEGMQPRRGRRLNKKHQGRRS